MNLKKDKIRKIAVALSLAVFVFLYNTNAQIKLFTKDMLSKVAVMGVALTIPKSATAKIEKTEETTKPKAQSTTAPSVATTVATTTSTQTKTQSVSGGGYSGKVVTTQIGNGGLYYKGVYLSNKTPLDISLKKAMNNKPKFKIAKNSEPQVLIYHTHATECYLPEDNGFYKNSWPSRTTDNNKNVVAVGDAIAKKLNEAGIVTLHDTTQHDKVSYNGSYDRSTKTVEKYLKEYPSISVVLDIHRDAITGEDGTKIKPTVTINGKKAAQIMICTGSQSGGVEGYPNWKENLRFAVQVQKSGADLYPGLMRPIYFVSKKYNHHLSTGSILLEMGSEGNTLEEAVYSGELLGDALVKTFSTTLAK